jgi:hypothetical protein
MGAWGGSDVKISFDQIQKANRRARVVENFAMIFSRVCECCSLSEQLKITPPEVSHSAALESVN